MLPLGEIIKEKEDTDTNKIGAEADEVKCCQKKKALEAQIELMHRKLQTAERNVERAQVEVDRLRYDPIMPELSVWEEIELVRRLIPTNIEPPKKGEAHPRISMGVVQWQADRKHRTRSLVRFQGRCHRKIGKTRSGG